jgi:hypothetical protein
MSKIVRHEFMGSWLLFWFFCITVIGIPLGVIYYRNGMVRIEDDLENPEEALAAYRAKQG